MQKIKLSKKELLYTAIIFIGIFVFNWYLMANLIGEKNNACSIGANLTPKNIFYNLISSILLSLVFVKAISIAWQRKSPGSTISLPIIGGLLSSLTMFCTACSIPIISLLGLSGAFTFINSYDIYFQLFTIAILLFSLHQLEKQSLKACRIKKSPL